MSARADINKPMILFVLIADTPVKSGETTMITNWENLFRDVFSSLYIFLLLFFFYLSPSFRGRVIRAARALSTALFFNFIRAFHRFTLSLYLSARRF
jgi:hypothetical protein